MGIFVKNKGHSIDDVPVTENLSRPLSKEEREMLARKHKNDLVHISVSYSYLYVVHYHQGAERCLIYIRDRKFMISDIKVDVKI